MPSVTAKRRCPDLIFVKPRFDVYRAVSRQIRAIFAEYTPLIEPLSLDEAYLDVTENLKAIASATAIAEEIRARIRDETGLTASAGVSYNKFLAKMASDQRKPDGLFVITPRMGPAFVEAPAGRQVPRDRPRDARQDGAARDPHRRRPEGPDACRSSRQHFGKAGRYYYAARAGHRRSTGLGRSHPQVRRCRDDVRRRPLHRSEEARAARAARSPKVWAYCEGSTIRGAR